MTVSKKEEYDNQFTLTRSEMAKELGITTNALKCRMRKGNTEGLDFRHDGNKFLFKRLRGNQHGQTPLNIRPKGRWHDGNKKKKKDWSEIRRGVTHIGEAKYPNEPFRQHNELKILNRITKEVPQYVIDKINPKLLSLAEQQYQSELLDKAQGTFSAPKYYGGRTNTDTHRNWKSNYSNLEDNTFNPRDKPQVNKGNYNYYDGPSNSDDGSVEINLDRVEAKSVIQREPEFRNKVDEAIYRAKKKYY